jgi:hypothetical protein
VAEASEARKALAARRAEREAAAAKASAKKAPKATKAAKKSAKSPAKKSTSTPASTKKAAKKPAAKKSTRPRKTTGSPAKSAATTKGRPTMATKTPAAIRAAAKKKATTDRASKLSEAAAFAEAYDQETDPDTKRQILADVPEELRRYMPDHFAADGTATWNAAPANGTAVLPGATPGAFDLSKVPDDLKPYVDKTTGKVKVILKNNTEADWDWDDVQARRQQVLIVDRLNPTQVIATDGSSCPKPSDAKGVERLLKGKTRGSGWVERLKKP